MWEREGRESEQDEERRREDKKKKKERRENDRCENAKDAYHRKYFSKVVINPSSLSLARASPSDPSSLPPSSPLSIVYSEPFDTPAEPADRKLSKVTSKSEKRTGGEEEGSTAE